MSDSDISLFSDSENENDTELRVSSRVGLRNVATAWNDVDVDELERSARGISSCLQTNGGLSNHELPQSGTLVTELEGSLLFKEFEGQNPHAFIRERFQNANIQDLVAARETLSKESLSHSKQLKKFVKDNFESCISNMDTIGEVAMRLHAASLEGGEGAHGATPAKVAEELHHVESVAEKSFSGLIKRYKLGQNLDSVLQLLGKYDSLVILPSMVREAIDSKDFEGVISLYQRAMNLVEMESGTTEEVHTIWNRLQTEVDKAMEAAVRTLHMMMHNPKMLLEESFEAASYLENLKKLGVPAAADMDTMQEFTDFQVNEIISEMRTIHKEAQDLKRDSSVEERKHSHTWIAEQSHISTSRLCIQNLTVEFYEWCHEFWDLFKPSKNIEPFKCLWNLGQEYRENALERVFSAYSELIESCMVEICETNDIVHESYAVIEFLTDCCFELDDDIGRVITPYYRDLAEHVCQQVILALVAHLKTHAQKVFVIEDSCMDGFLPHQNIAWLHMVINEAMECISKLSKRAMTMKVKVPPDSYPLHSLLKSCAETCADSVTRLAARKPVLSISGKEVDEFVLLVAWNTLEAVKISVLPQIVQTWSSLLNSSAATPKENSQAFSWCCSKLEEAQEFVMKSWVEIKLEKLEPIMVDVLDVESRHGANTIVDLSIPKACILELCSIVDAYDADIQIMVPVLQEEVMGEIHLAVIEGILNLMASDIFKTASMQGVCQLWLDLSALHDWLLQHENEDDHMDRKGSVTLAESLLAEIEEHVRKHLKDESLTVIKVKERIRNILDSH